MATYVIGDVQGCFTPLQRLLDKINFDSSDDTLWFAGDLVNRGPESLQTLRFVKSLNDSAVTVLGNHDIHLLALYYGLRPRDKDPTLEQVLEASDADILITWLQRQPLLHCADNHILVHAGLHPQWTLETAQALATELQQILSSINHASSLAPLYGPSSGSWSDAAQSQHRLRYALNCFTRLRFCTHDGIPDDQNSCQPGEQPDSLIPWFDVTGRPTSSSNILFGHWAALGVLQQPGINALDSGCVWGNTLTALRLEDQELFNVSCGTD